MRKVLILGAGGFVGKHLIEEFSGDYEVIPCDLGEQFPRSVDVTDAEVAEKLIRETRPDFLVNLAAIASVGVSWQIPAKTMSVNVGGTLNLLEAIRKYSPETKSLFVGSSEEYRAKMPSEEELAAVVRGEIPENLKLKESDPVDSNNPYGISKIAQENFAKLYAEKYGLKIVLTRSFNHIGVGQSENFVGPSFAKQIAEIERGEREPVLRVGNLEAYRDFSDVSDVVHVYRKLLETENAQPIYNVGSGKAYQIREILNILLSFSEKEIRVETDPAKMRPADTPFICADNSSVAEFFPGTPIEKTLEKVFRAY